LILKEIGQWLFTFKKSELNYQNLNVYVDRMARIQGGCERISNTPIPFAYSLGLHRTIYIFCTLYPLLLIDTLGYLSLLFSVFTTYTLLSLDTIAEELEDPFGYEDNDLPLDAICNTIDIDLRQMMGDHHHPTKSTPDRKYRLS
jgi:putative membrane protein